jgi:ABC-type transport system involved in cytochrome bd biosynthesis fused ATPase/permease subunit
VTRRLQHGFRSLNQSGRRVSAFRPGDLFHRNHSLVVSGDAFSGTDSQHELVQPPRRARGSRGEFDALVGHNGAGRTTTLRMVAGLLRPGAGSIVIDRINALADSVAAKQITAWLSDGVKHKPRDSAAAPPAARPPAD